MSGKEEEETLNSDIEILYSALSGKEDNNSVVIKKDLQGQELLEKLEGLSECDNYSAKAVLTYSDGTTKSSFHCSFSKNGSCYEADYDSDSKSIAFDGNEIVISDGDNTQKYVPSEEFTLENQFGIPSYGEIKHLLSEDCCISVAEKDGELLYLIEYSYENIDKKLYISLNYPIAVYCEDVYEGITVFEYKLTEYSVNGEVNE